MTNANGKKRVGSKQAKQGQREWILPCNENYYNIADALKTLKKIDWRQVKAMKNACVGDLVYLYCISKKGGEIKYKGAILEVNKMENIIDDSTFSTDGGITQGPCIEIAMFREYELTGELTYAKLKEHGLLSRLQGPVIVKEDLAGYLHDCDKRQRILDRFDGTIPDSCLSEFPIKVYENLETPDNLMEKPLDDSHDEQERIEHAKRLSLNRLKEIAMEQGRMRPKKMEVTATQIVRDPYIAEYTKRMANGKCQLCGKPAPFLDKDGNPYLESHHIVWLSKGGADSVDNTAALCPNCHKKMHVVNDPKDVEKLQLMRKKQK